MYFNVFFLLSDRNILEYEDYLFEPCGALPFFLDFRGSAGFDERSMKPFIAKSAFAGPPCSNGKLVLQDVLASLPSAASPAFEFRLEGTFENANGRFESLTATY